MEIIKDEKQDFILDSEKKQIEVKILEAVEAKQHIEEAKKESEKDIQQKSLKKPKATLISEFIELQKTVCTKDKDGLEILEYPESALKKLTKPEIIKLIANYANRKIETSNNLMYTPSNFESLSFIENLKDSKGQKKL